VAQTLEWKPFIFCDGPVKGGMRCFAPHMQPGGYGRQQRNLCAPPENGFSQAPFAISLDQGRRMDVPLTDDD
jgi:hypothetical protein